MRGIIRKEKRARSFPLEGRQAAPRRQTNSTRTDYKPPVVCTTGERAFVPRPPLSTGFPPDYPQRQRSILYPARRRIPYVACETGEDIGGGYDPQGES